MRNANLEIKIEREELFITIIYYISAYWGDPILSNTRKR